VGEKRGLDIVSCPTCGRTKIDLISLVDSFEKRIKEEGLERKNIKVALMGCVVNGPGEAREADIGIAGGKGEALLFKKGEIIAKLQENELVDRLVEEIEKM
jgi:(E)-4-hydroxy-3-methylbut-2-enyl-diphosphate synthase